jgi:hypothetical protein
VKTKAAAEGDRDRAILVAESFSVDHFGARETLKWFGKSEQGQA